jgi:hypothetical protein
MGVLSNPVHDGERVDALMTGRKETTARLEDHE